jgi:hypothetical protein
MKPCELCGNESNRTFEVISAGVSHTFDSIECAATVIAPHCKHCDCRILGHAYDVDGDMFCCVHCAEMFGQQELRAKS